MDQKPWLALCITLFVSACATSEKDINLAKVHLKTGTQYLIKGQALAAISTLEEAKQLNPQDPTVFNNLGLAYFLNKDFEKSENSFKKAIQLNPQYTDAKNNFARVLIELLRYDEAISILLPITHELTYPTIEKAYINLGLAYLKKGEHQLALSQFKKAVSANKNFCPAHNYYGQALFQLQKFEEATESFETALKLCNNSYDEAHYYSGLSYYKVGQREKALARLEEVVKLYPDTEYANKAKAMLKIMR